MLIVIMIIAMLMMVTLVLMMVNLFAEWDTDESFFASFQT